MIGYIFGIGIIILLIIITIIASSTYLLTERQFKELWISSILFVILLGYTRAKILKLEPIDVYIFVPAFLYILWFFFTKFSANLINKDDNMIGNITMYNIMETVIGTIIFLFIFGYFRSMILNLPIDSINIITTTVLFFLWYSLSNYITDLSINK